METQHVVLFSSYSDVLGVGMAVRERTLARQVRAPAALLTEVVWEGLSREAQGVHCCNTLPLQMCFRRSLCFLAVRGHAQLPIHEQGRLSS